jgi:flagellar hook-basal body complex protein FliE
MTEDLGIQQLRSLLESPAAGATAGIRPPRPARAEGAPDGPAAPSFADILKESIKEVNALKLQADKAIEELASGQSGDIQGTIIAVEKADISFKLMMEVRSKIISAYQEVMGMQV